MTEQPWLHRLHIAVDGPATALSSAAGDMAGAATGWFVDDRRVLRGLELTLDGERPEPVAVASRGAITRVWSAARHLGTLGADPTVEVHRTLELNGQDAKLTVVITSRATSDVTTHVQIALISDSAALSSIKAGDLPVNPGPDMVLGACATWSDGRHQVRAVAHPPASIRQPSGLDGSTFGWDLRVRPGCSVSVELLLQSTRLQQTYFDS
ncbi:MAG: glycogen debranching N-terminal domain-containing protein, partial [Ornithinimicrobium sp.]